MVIIGNVDGIDGWWLGVNRSLEDPSIVGVFKVLTHLGSGYLLYPIAIALLVMSRGRERMEYSILLGAMASSSVLVNAIKVLFARDRPPFPSQYLSSYSYPSGHACLSFVFYWGVLLISYRRGYVSRNVALALAISLPSIVSFSRTYLRVHYLSDIVGSFLLAFMLICLFFSSCFGNTKR